MAKIGGDRTKACMQNYAKLGETIEKFKSNVSYRQHAISASSI